MFASVQPGCVACLCVLQLLYCVGRLVIKANRADDEHKYCPVRSIIKWRYTVIGNCCRDHGYLKGPEYLPSADCAVAELYLFPCPLGFYSRHTLLGTHPPFVSSTQSTIQRAGQTSYGRNRGSIVYSSSSEPHAANNTVLQYECTNKKAPNIFAMADPRFCW